MLADYHMHTSFSDDSVYPMEEEIKHAIAIGLDEICFTEHLDYVVKTTDNCDCEAYKKEFDRCRQIYGGQITMKFGMEFGVQVGTIPEFQENFEAYPYDFIILSCHQADNRQFYNQEYQKGKTQEEYNRGYYEEILKVMKNFNDYSILGHLDMIKRYDELGEYPFEKVEDLITEILKMAISKGKGIEVNTSCFRYGLPDLTPARNIIQLYRDLGGEIITIGSDAHMKEHVGCKIAYIQEELKKMEFTHFYTFDKMKPVKHSLCE